MPPKLIVNASSLNLVGSELAKLVREANAEFEGLKQGIPASSGTSCLAKLQQIAGIFRLLELDDAAMLADELRALLLAPDRRDGATDSLEIDLAVRAFSMLGNYPDYLTARRSAVPALLMEDINALRALRKQPALPESLFVGEALDAESRCPGEPRRLTGEEELELVKRLRHIYQVGLLGILKGRSDPVHLRLMQRACGRMERLSGGGCSGEFWWLLHAVLDGLASGGLTQTPARNRLLTNADRQFRATLQSDGDLPATPDVIRRELIYLAAQCGDGSRAKEIRSSYGLQGQILSDAELALEREALLGPSGDTIQSMVDALKSELDRAKGVLEQAARSGSEAPPEEVGKGLSRVASVLKGAGMRSSAQTLEDQVQRLDECGRGNAAMGSSQLLEVADAVLYVETTLDGLRRSRKAGDLYAVQSGSNGTAVSSGILAEAQNVVFGEAARSLDSVKRAVSAFVEAGYDSSALAGAGATMRAVAGSMGILNQSEAAHVLDLAARTADLATREAGQDKQVDLSAVAEGFADVLVCIEYFIGALSQDIEPEPSILTMAEESLKAIYAPVAQAS